MQSTSTAKYATPTHQGTTLASALTVKPMLNCRNPAAKLDAYFTALLSYSIVLQPSPQSGLQPADNSAHPILRGPTSMRALSGHPVQLDLIVEGANYLTCTHPRPYGARGA